MTDHVYRSAITGGFVTPEFAAKHPDTTYRDTISRDDGPTPDMVGEGKLNGLAGNAPDTADLASRVKIARGLHKPETDGVYCVCLNAGMDPRKLTVPCEYADRHAAGLRDAAARSAEHEAAQGYEGM